MQLDVCGTTFGSITANNLLCFHVLFCFDWSPDLSLESSFSSYVIIPVEASCKGKSTVVFGSFNTLLIGVFVRYLSMLFSLFHRFRVLTHLRTWQVQLDIIHLSSLIPRVYLQPHMLQLIEAVTLKSPSTVTTTANCSCSFNFFSSMLFWDCCHLAIWRRIFPYTSAWFNFGVSAWFSDLLFWVVVVLELKASVIGLFLTGLFVFDFALHSAFISSTNLQILFHDQEEIWVDH